MNENEVYRGKRVIRIRRVDAFFALLVFFLLYYLLNFAHSQYLGVFIYQEGFRVEPVFNETGLLQALPFLNAAIIIGIVKHLSKFIIGRLNILMAILICFLNLASIVLIFNAFNNQNIWNLELLQTLQLQNEDIFIKIYSFIRRFFHYILIIPLVVETVSIIFYKR